METNYRIWRQYDDDWNREEAWPEAEFPDAGSRYLRKSGCFITSVAIMLRRYHIEKEENPELFNPLILCEKLKKSGKPWPGRVHIIFHIADELRQ